MYEHFCKGTPESKDVPKPTETIDIDDTELAPPQKCVKLSTLAEHHRDADGKSLDDATNSLQKQEVPSNDTDERSQEEKKSETLQPETDAAQQTHEGKVENGFSGLEQMNEFKGSLHDDVPTGPLAALQPGSDAIKQQKLEDVKENDLSGFEVIPPEYDPAVGLAALQAEFDAEPQALGNNKENDFAGFEVMPEYLRPRFEVLPVPVGRLPTLQPQNDVEQRAPADEEENDLFGFEQMNEYLRARHGGFQRFAHGRNENRAERQRRLDRGAHLIEGRIEQEQIRRRRMYRQEMVLNGDYGGPA